MRKLGIALILACVTSAADAPECMSAAVAFDLHWDRYVRRLFGCPAFGETTTAVCHKENSVVDYAEFAKAREQAKRVFGLKD